MEIVVSTHIDAQDLPARVDLPRMGVKGAGKINRGKFTLAQQKAVEVSVVPTRITRQGGAVTSRDVALSIDPQRVGEDGTGNIYRNELAFA